GHAASAISKVGARRSASGPASRYSDTVVTHKVFGYHPSWAGASFQNYDYALLTHVAYFSAEADPSTGKIANAHDWKTTGLVAAAEAGGVKPILTATCMGPAQNTALLSDPARRATFIGELADLAAAHGAAGVNIDFEQMPKAQRGVFAAFMASLAAGVRARIPGAEISAALPAVDWQKAYDGVALAGACDYLLVMGYDFHWRNSQSAGPVAPLQTLLSVQGSVQKWMQTGVPAAKLLLGVPYYGYDWPVRDNQEGSSTTGAGKAILFRDAKPAVLQHGRNWDAASSSPWYTYSTPNWWRQTWYEDEESLSAKYNFVKTAGLGGVGLWALSYDGTNRDLWDALKAAFAETGGV
ncbi:MAG: glycosyl hydrolase family 18 protein, partial [Bryobacteraceae bacterium]